MPRRDGTGPMSGGSKTGRGLGNCTTEEATSNDNNFRGPGRGLGNFATGRHSGRGCRKGIRSVDNAQDTNLR